MGDGDVNVELTVEDRLWVDTVPALFDVTDEQPSRLLIDAACAVLDEAPGLAPNPPVTIAVLLADDGRVAELNQQFRDKIGPTNVLSFPDGTSADGEGGTHLGDLALARETIFREAAEQGKSVFDHSLHLVVHGILHLLGYDHGTERAALEMENLERHILADLGIADPYESGALGNAATHKQGDMSCITGSTAHSRKS